MSYLVHSDDDRRCLLEAVGAESIQDLFSSIPAVLRRAELNLAPGMSEAEVRAHMEALEAANRPLRVNSFLGAGCYNHFVPAAVRALVSRGEFATAYTPYQPEVSQGTLQGIFEFQTCICELTGLEVANASLYDGPSALAEAAFMALRLTRRETIVVSAGLHPEAAQVVETFAAGPGFLVQRIPLDPLSGTTDLTQATLSSDVGVVLVQQPNCLGVIEDLRPLADAAHNAEALLVVSVDPSTLGILEAPGRLGADIVVGDAQVFGNAPSFGGPSVGFWPAPPLICDKCRVASWARQPMSTVAYAIPSPFRPVSSISAGQRPPPISAPTRHLALWPRRSICPYLDHTGLGRWARSACEERIISIVPSPPFRA